MCASAEKCAMNGKVEKNPHNGGERDSETLCNEQEKLSIRNIYAAVHVLYLCARLFRMKNFLIKTIREI